MLARKENCFIQTCPISGSRVLCDEEGDVVHRFPKDTPSDLIWHALSWANFAHAMGVQKGIDLKTAEIRAALGIYPCHCNDRPQP